jgi:hypothetical protein
MGMRVRKAAKVLDCSPEDVIGLLLALGITRYKTTQDQLSDRIVTRLQEAVRSGLKPVQTVVKEHRKKNKTPPPLVVGSSVMDSLMRAEEAAEVADPTVPAPQTPDALIDVKRAQDGNFQVELRELAHQKALLEQDRQVLAEQKRLHAAQVQQAVQDKSAATPPKVVTRPTTLGSLLEERGLTTLDQWDAALVALGKGQLLAPLVETLASSEPQKFRRLFADKLLLVEGSPPTRIPPGMVTVQVPVGQGELPDGEFLERGLEALGERFLLHGMRRVVVCGGSHIGWWYLKEAMDARVLLEVSERLPIGKISADLVILWGYKLSDEERIRLDLTTATTLEAGSSQFQDLFLVTEAFFK